MSTTKSSTPRDMRDHAARVLAKQEADAQAKADPMVTGAWQAKAREIDPAGEFRLEPEPLDVAGAVENAAAEADIATEALAMREDMPLVMSTLLPVPRIQAVDWIMRNIVAHGAGTHICVGRAAGKAIRAEFRENEWQGKQLRSVLLTGMFRMESATTGQVFENAEIYLPNAYAKQVYVALEMAGTLITFDVDIGIEATGRTIPYRWTVISRHRWRRPDAEFEQLWSRRQIQPSLIAGPETRKLAG